LKDKDGVPKRREEQLIIYEGNSIRLLADFSSEILEAKESQVAEIRRTTVQGQPGQIVCKTLSQKTLHKNKIGGVA
jgi:hypothetical protein